MFRALADPTRRAIFERLTHGEAAVKELTARFDVSQPAISQHLATLRGAGLVSERREGRLVYYRVDPSGHATKLCLYRKARGGSPNRRLEYVVVGDAVCHEEDRSLFKPELDELRRLFGLGPD